MKRYSLVMVKTGDLYDSYFPVICERHIYHSIGNGIREIVSKITSSSGGDLIFKEVFTGKLIYPDYEKYENKPLQWSDPYGYGKGYVENIIDLSIEEAHKTIRSLSQEEIKTYIEVLEKLEKRDIYGKNQSKAEYIEYKKRNRVMAEEIKNKIKNSR